jgi:hypothetical protein
MCALKSASCSFLSSWSFSFSEKCGIVRFELPPKIILERIAFFGECLKLGIVRLELPPKILLHRLYRGSQQWCHHQLQVGRGIVGIVLVHVLSGTAKFASSDVAAHSFQDALRIGVSLPVH